MRLAIVVAGVCATAFAPATAARNAATADLSVSISPRSAPVLAGAVFNFQVFVTNLGPDASPFNFHVLVPGGVRYESGGSCTGTGDLACPGNAGLVGDDGSAVLAFVADAPGSYTFVVRLTDLTATDPNPANNVASITITVAERPHVLVTSGLTIAPAKPWAGRSFVVSFRVLDKTAGEDVIPAAARCSASTGRVRAHVFDGRATCTVSTPRTARGRLVRGVLVAMVNGRRFSRRFAVRLR